MRILWGKVPYFIRTVKPQFGNLGKVVDSRIASDGTTIYRLHSVVDRTMYLDFYEDELKIAQ